MRGAPHTTSFTTLSDAGPHRHVLQCYGSDEDLLAENVSRFLAAGLARHEAALIVATPERRHRILQQMESSGAALDAARLAGHLVELDSPTVLESLLVDDRPDWNAFEKIVGSTVGLLARTAGEGQLRAFGDMVGLLWQSRRTAAAVALEGLWNRLLESHPFHLFCAYPIDVLGREFRRETVDQLFCCHTHVMPDNGELERSLARAMAEVLREDDQGMRLLLESPRRPTWALLPRAEALILALREDLPDLADKILGKARGYYDAARLARPSLA